MIGLVRPHLEKSKTPRSLFVPFQLGRPLGEPGDPAFQRRVLVAALRLLERKDGPVILEDFPDDAPGWFDTPDWRPAVALPRSASPTSGDAVAWATAFGAELDIVGHVQRQAVEERGRTTVGLSRQPVEAWPAYAAGFLSGNLPAPTPGLPSSALSLRFLCDDIKAFYGEAAQVSAPYPSSRQLDTWFWKETLAGALIQEVRRGGLGSDNRALATVAARFLVPRPYVQE